MVGHDLIRHIDSLMSDEIVDCESLKIAINKLVKAYIKNSDRLDKITKLSDKQQIEMLKLNENLESAYSELDIYKNHLEERVHAAVSDIRLLNEELSKTQIEVIFTMGAIGESRSKETGNHVKRVAEYSKILALAYGLDKEEAELLKRVSPMHDIGKVAIPDHILNKPGKLTEEEFAVMQKHTVIGYEMLSNSDRDIMNAARIVAHEHHEKYGGGGYPRGIAGEEIHIFGRITAIADVFDALGSDRCYKKAWDDDRIFSLFKEERGRHFDPLLVDAFFDTIKDILDIRGALKDEF